MYATAFITAALALGAQAAPLEARTGGSAGDQLELTQILGPLGELVNKINDKIPADVALDADVTDLVDQVNNLLPGDLKLDVPDISVRSAEPGVSIDLGARDPEPGVSIDLGARDPEPGVSIDFGV